MAAGSPQQTKRALAKVLLTVAAFYYCRLEVTRDSPDEVVLKAFNQYGCRASRAKRGERGIDETCVGHRMLALSDEYNFTQAMLKPRSAQDPVYIFIQSLRAFRQAAALSFFG